MVKFPQSYYASPAEQSKKTSDVMRDAYRNISSETIHKLWELYSVDYAMFNYPYPDDLGSNDNYQITSTFIIYKKFQRTSKTFAKIDKCFISKDQFTLAVKVTIFICGTFDLFNAF